MVVVVAAAAAAVAVGAPATATAAMAPAEVNPWVAVEVAFLPWRWWQERRGAPAQAARGDAMTLT